MSDIDFNAKDTMIKSKSNLKDYGTPYKSTGNGNCLFNSISSSLCGNETLATELRLRTAVEMITNTEVYTSRQDYDKIYDYSPSFDEAMLACCDDGEFSSIWNLMALANVIGSPIQSLYPRMNSEKDEAHLWLSVLACDENTKDRTRFNILWTHVGPKRKGAWTANHFVPVLMKLFLKQQQTAMLQM